MELGSLEWWLRLLLLITSHGLTASLVFLFLRAKNRNILSLKSHLLNKRMEVLEEHNTVAVDIPIGAKLIWDFPIKKACRRCRNGNIVARLRYKIVERDKRSVKVRPLTCFYYCSHCAFKGVHLGKKMER